LRLSLAFVFIWFGALKLVGASPVIDLINKTYPFLPEPLFCTILGAIEVLTGIGLLFHFTRSLALILLSGELVGIFLAERKRELDSRCRLRAERGGTS
jgi:uncharacterized membrane protein YphA (DoxX/SURF4 family)